MMAVKAEQRRWRKLAGDAVRTRLDELQESAASLARRAAVDPKTIRSLINGESWPTAKTRGRIEKALDWPDGTMVRRAMSDDEGLAAYSTRELLLEVCRRTSSES
jgi:ribosome-binding protein aMBF1 (putative translation factor)